MRLQIEVSDLPAMRQCLARFDISNVPDADLLAIIAESSAVASELLADSLEDTAGRDYLIDATVAYAMRHIEDKPMEPLVGGAVYAEWHWPANASSDAYVREFEAAMSKSTRLLGWSYAQQCAAASPAHGPMSRSACPGAGVTVGYSARLFTAPQCLCATPKLEVWQLDVRPGWLRIGLESIPGAPWQSMFSVPLYDDGVRARSICVGLVDVAAGIRADGGRTNTILTDRHAVVVWRAAE